jgi:predicted house-cleaning noncanonical NTP pyrophosphatase (MazG superfamily)
MDIQKIINSALKLDKNHLKEYFALHQKESGLKPELFFEFVLGEIKEKKKNINTDFSRIHEEKYHYSIINSHQVDELASRMKFIAGLIVLEDFLKSQLDSLRRRNKNSSGPILTPDEGLTSKVLPPFIGSDKLDDNYSNNLKSLEKISENHFKEGPKIKNTKTDTKNSDVQGQGTQTPIIEYPFNRMPIDQVRLFFTPLIETENNEGNRWMSPESFEIFLRRSFEKESSLLKPDINLGKGTKGAIIKLFYEFYDHCVDKNYSSKRNKKPYVNLLRDAFNTGIFNNLDDDSFNDKAKWGWPDFKSKV